MNSIAHALTNWFEISPMSKETVKKTPPPKKNKNKATGNVNRSEKAQSFKEDISTFIDFVSNRQQFRLTIKFRIEL